MILPCWTVQTGSIVLRTSRAICVATHDDEVLMHLYLFHLFSANMRFVMICNAVSTALTRFEELRYFMGKPVTLQHASVDANRTLTTTRSIQFFKCRVTAHHRHQCRRNNDCSANTPVHHDFLFLTLPACEPFWSSSDLSSASPVATERCEAIYQLVISCG